MWGIPFRRQTENINDNGNASVDFYIYRAHLSSKRYPSFLYSNEKFKVKISYI